MVKKLINKNWWLDLILIVLIFFLSVLAFKNLLIPGFFQTFDGDFHLAHLYWFDKAIRQGHFPVRWVEEINRGRGYPFFNFYYPFLYYLAEIPYFLGLGLVNSLKLVLIFSFPLGGIFMYYWIKDLWGRLPALVSGILWIYAPYRFVSVYVAARFGEVVAFMFIPLVFLYLTRLVKSGKRVYLFLAVASWAALILSHNIQALLFSPIILIYFCWLQYQNHQPIKLSTVLILVGLTLGASAYFWAPVLMEKQWTSQGQQPAYDFRTNFPKLTAYLYQPWGYGLDTTGKTGGVSLQIGIGQLLALISAVFLVIYTKKFKFDSKRKISWPIFWIAMSVIVFGLMNKITLPVWKIMPLLAEIQIPSRFLGLMVFISAAVVGWVVWWPQKRYLKLLIGIIFIFITLYANRNYMRPGYFERYSDQYYINNVDLLTSTTDPYGENTPVWSQFSWDTYTEKVITDPRSNQKAVIKDLSLRPRNYTFVVEAPNQTWIKVMTVYYPGWRIKLDGKSYKFAFDQMYGLDDLGQLILAVPAGTHKVQIWYEETYFRKLVNLVSLISWLMVVYQLFSSRWYRKRD